MKIAGAAIGQGHKVNISYTRQMW